MQRLTTFLLSALLIAAGTPTLVRASGDASGTKEPYKPHLVTKITGSKVTTAVFFLATIAVLYHRYGLGLFGFCPSIRMQLNNLASEAEREFKDLSPVIAQWNKELGSQLASKDRKVRGEALRALLELAGYNRQQQGNSQMPQAVKEAVIEMRQRLDELLEKSDDVRSNGTKLLVTAFVLFVLAVGSGMVGDVMQKRLAENEGEL